MNAVKRLSRAFAAVQKDTSIVRNQLNRLRDRTSSKKFGRGGSGVARPEWYDQMRVGAVSSLIGADLQATLGGKKALALGFQQGRRGKLSFSDQDKRDVISDVVLAMKEVK